jgi:hypothetical protein
VWDSELCVPSHLSCRYHNTRHRRNGVLGSLVYLTYLPTLLLNDSPFARIPRLLSSLPLVVHLETPLEERVWYHARNVSDWSESLRSDFRPDLGHPGAPSQLFIVLGTSPSTDAAGKNLLIGVQE